MGKRKVFYILFEFLTLLCFLLAELSSMFYLFYSLKREELFCQKYKLTTQSLDSTKLIRFQKKTHFVSNIHPSSEILTVIHQLTAPIESKSNWTEKIRLNNMRRLPQQECIINLRQINHFSRQISHFMTSRYIPVLHSIIARLNELRRLFPSAPATFRAPTLNLKYG